jgi:hypothetical protein
MQQSFKRELLWHKVANQNAMLPDAVELWQMASKAADVREGGRNVLNNNGVFEYRDS